MREATTIDCKRSFVRTNQRVNAGRMPVHFPDFCPASGPTAGVDVGRGPDEREPGPHQFLARQRPRKPTDRELRLAYAIFVSPADPHWRIYRMMAMLYNEHDFFFLHVDSLRNYSMASDHPPSAATPTSEPTTESSTCSKDQSCQDAVKELQHLLRDFVSRGNVQIGSVFDVSWGGEPPLRAHTRTRAARARTHSMHARKNTRARTHTYARTIARACAHSLSTERERVLACQVYV